MIFPLIACSWREYVLLNVVKIHLLDQVIILVSTFENKDRY